LVLKLVSANTVETLSHLAEFGVGGEGPHGPAQKRDITYVEKILKTLKKYQSTTKSGSLPNKPTMATAITA
jgi:hypothetical protein